METTDLGNNFLHNNDVTKKYTRTRKISLDHSGSLPLDFNGNRAMCRRISSLAGNTSHLTSLQSYLSQALTQNQDDTLENIGEASCWENAFIQQIQSLIANVKVSDPLSKCIKEEILSDDNSFNTTALQRTRRKSCFSLSKTVNNNNNGHRQANQPMRKISVTRKEDIHANTAPRRRASHAGMDLPGNYNTLYKKANPPDKNTSTTGWEETSVQTKAPPRRRASHAGMDVPVNFNALYRQAHVPERNSTPETCWEETPVLTKPASRRRVSHAGLDVPVNYNALYRQAHLPESKTSDTCWEEPLVQTRPAPRRRMSHADINMLDNYNSLYRHAHLPGRRMSVTRQDSTSEVGLYSNPPPSNNRRRRMSVNDAGGDPHLSALRGRRASLAHAYKNNAMPQLRRLGSINDEFVPGQVNYVRQRRISTVKQACITVTKISSVQKRLHRIYRQRRRKDRASVDIKDVRRAMSGDADVSESECNNDNDNSDADIADENSNGSADTTLIDMDPDVGFNECDDNKVNGNEVDLTEDEPKPSPRRKTSIQVRSWELSRRLRQRRREKRKGCNESDLI